MIFEILVGLFCLVLYVYYKLSKNKNYWDDRGIPNTGFKFFWGDEKGMITQKESFHEHSLRIYNMFPKEKFVGSWTLFGSPYLFIRNDFDLIRSIWIKDFDHFAITNGNMKDIKSYWPASRNEKLMLNNIQSAHGDEWKDIRSTFTPVFTSGKLRKMTPLLQAINRKMNTYVKSLAEDGEAFETKDLTGRFSLDGLATSAFGVEAGSFNKEESEFLKHAKAVFKPTKWTFPQLILGAFTPNIIKKVATTLGAGQIFTWPFANDHSNFLMHVVDESFKQRKGSGTKRNDLLDLMIDAIDGNLEDLDDHDIHSSDQFEKDAKIVDHVKNKGLAYDDVVATAMLLLAAGYDTTGTALSWILYDLAMNPNCQDTLYEEIRDAGSDASKLSYESLQSLPYLDAVIHETLRRHTPIATLERCCSKDYHVPGTDIIIKKGQIVRASNAGICMDADIFPNPYEYNPENFLKENSSDRNPYSFLTFSLGPRNCIGMRFSMFEMKVCITSLVSKFNFIPCEKTTAYENLDYDPADFFGRPKNGLWIKCEARD